MFEELGSLRDLRHIDKILYLGSDDMFYELNYNHYRPSSELLSIVKQIFHQSPKPWRALREGVWTHVVPLGTDTEAAPVLLKQGWKIHISATNANCAEVLHAVASLLIPRRTQFKFANDIETLRLMTSKRWARGGSGKFITIYPSSVEDFRTVIDDVYHALKGFRGSYILSDRRYKDSGCVYYRFGGIVSTKINDTFGRSFEVLTAPDGTQVHDKRNPFYELPYWVDEVFPEEHPEPDDGEMSLCEGRFAVESALSFSNTGGVYLAVDNQTGKRVVVKEARPGVELGANGDDATTRLAHEADILQAMNDSGVTPRVVTTFWDWENFYLAEEHLEARNMRRIMLDHSPLLKVNPDRSSRDEFYSIFKSIFVSLLNAVAEFHRRGIVIGDLAPTNILVEDDTLTVKIIDLEGAFRTASNVTQDLHTPGFRPQVKGRKKESDYRDDLYAVGAIMMYSMFPLAAMAYLRSDLFDRVLPVIVDDIGWSDTPVLRIVRQLTDGSISCADAASMLESGAAPGGKLPSRADVSAATPAELSRGLGRFIVNNWRADAAYTLFPIDPYGQTTNPAGFFLGSSGIVWALAQTGIDIPGEAMERFQRELSSTKPDSLPPGLLTGTAGMAWALFELGDHEQATRFLDSTNSRQLEQCHHSLYYGLAGLGLTNIVAYRRTGDDGYLRRAALIAESLERSARSDERGVWWEDSGGIRLGFGYGQSGVALFLLRLSQISGVTKWRDLGRRAVEFDLSFGIQMEAGVTGFGGEPDHRGTLLPYIEQGSGGIAKVAMRYGIWDNLDPIIADVHRKYSGFPGLIYGLTAFLDVLTDAQRYSGDEAYGAMALRPLQGLRDLYLFDTPQGLAAPGENLFRVSCDYATGLAGIMYTLHRHAHLSADSLTLDWLDGEATSARRGGLAGDE